VCKSGHHTSGIRGALKAPRSFAQNGAPSIEDASALPTGSCAVSFVRMLLLPDSRLGANGFFCNTMAALVGASSDLVPGYEFHGHTDWVWSVTSHEEEGGSPESLRLVSSSDDCYLCIWGRGGGTSGSFNIRAGSCASRSSKTLRASGSYDSKHGSGRRPQGEPTRAIGRLNCTSKAT
jgi:hypothetical protein